MAFRSRNTSLILLCLISTGPTLRSQHKAPPAKLDARALTLAALDRWDASSSSTVQFTNLLLRHTFNYSSGGEKTFDLTQLFEETWINGLPYHRLIEVNGHPLEGKALQEEQARFDEAVAKHAPLGNLERVLLSNAHPVNTGANPHQVLEPGYVFQEVSQNDSPHGRLHVIEATPTQHSITGCAWQFRMWISEQDPTLFHYYADVWDEKNAPEVCLGSTDEAYFEVVDGSPKVVHTHSHLYREDRNLVDSDDVYSHYRRFHATITLSAAPGPPPSDAGTSAP